MPTAPARPARRPRATPRPAARARAPAPSPTPTGGDRVVLRGVTWGEYAALRRKPGNDGVRMTYDGPAGLLELEMPGQPHEVISRLLHSFVTAFARERRIALMATGSITQGRADLTRGLEGDESYYVSHFDTIRGREVDLAAGDPPPDLAVEVDVTNPSVPKLPIYAALGVPEVWTWSGGAIAVRRLNAAGEYDVEELSRELPGFPLRAAERLLARWADAPEYELAEEFRDAARGG